MAISQVAKGLIWTTIGANVYVFARWHIVPDEQAAKQGPESRAYRMAKSKQLQYMNDNYTLSRKNVAEGRWWTIITSAFSHIDLAHMGINMLVLHSTASLGISGAIGLGPIRLTALALGSAVCGSLGSLYDYQKTAEAGLQEPRGLGASGMVEGVMMATMLAQPRWPVSPLNSTDWFPLSLPEQVRGGYEGDEMCDDPYLPRLQLLHLYPVAEVVHKSIC
ncbi:hypothetical protein FJTKL_13997 [Diaporthe vaccinii]|uniref:Peptidase S54 rhomboid domain-containing protein n=1 Tax=Diaporthe vaccinii TaxID=105482 RepID=A0ABR4E9C2_9PEZI